MLAKLGNVTYWLSCGAAVMIVVWGLKLWLESERNAVSIIIVFGIAAGVVWLIGFAFRYVLRKLVW